MLNTFIAITLFSCLLSCFAQTGPSWVAQPFNPPALPLAVKSPYLNVWLPQGNTPPQNGKFWPNFWNIANNLGWSMLVRVDGETYSIVGNTLTPKVNTPKQLSTSFTATQTIFNYQAGPVGVTTTFLSPISTSDLVRQSIPFSYFSVNVSSLDGQPHQVEMYSDFAGGLLSGDSKLNLTWSQGTQNGVVTLQASLLSPQPFAEAADEALDSTLFLAIPDSSDVTWQIDPFTTTRTQFNNSGSLLNTQNNNFRAINDDWPEFAISRDLGTVQSSSSSVTWAVGLVRDPVIQYATASGVEQRSPYWRSQFDSVHSMIAFFIQDYPNSVQAATELDSKIQTTASVISPHYADLVALSLRQVLSATDFTIQKGSDGQWNTSDIKGFMKNIASVGGGGVNSVDVLYASFPMFLYLNATWGGYFLAPLLEYQDSSLISSAYAAQDLGALYPNATSARNPISLGVEESANMLILSLAYSQGTGDTVLISRHYNLLRNWTEYLVSNALSPGAQTTANGFPGANQTNLALKGIVGISAMARISAAAGSKNDQERYQNISQSYIQQWSSLTVADDGSHLLSRYGAQGSSGMMYNLYADKLLQLNLVPSSVYKLQTSFLTNSLSGSQYGLSIDSSANSTARTDWTMLAVGALTDPAAQTLMISQLWSYAASNQDDHPLSVVYDPTTGNATDGIASPAQGAMFSLLALQESIYQLAGTGSGQTSPGQGQTGQKSKTNIGLIAGAAIGGVIGLIILSALALLYIRRRKSRRQNIQSMSYRSSVPILADSTFPVYSDISLNDPEQPPSVAHNNLSECSSSANTRSIGRAKASSSYDPYAAVPLEPMKPFKHKDTQIEHPLSPRTDENDVGLSVSEIGMSRTASTDVTSDTGATSVILRAKRTLITEQLRDEVANLRQVVERLQEDRGNVLIEVEEPPPGYSPGPVS